MSEQDRLPAVNRAPKPPNHNRSARIALLSGAAAVALVIAYGVGKDVKEYEMTGCTAKADSPLQWIEAPIANTIGGEEDQAHPFSPCTGQP